MVLSSVEPPRATDAHIFLSIDTGLRISDLATFDITTLVKGEPRFPAQGPVSVDRAAGIATI